MDNNFTPETMIKLRKALKLTQVEFSRKLKIDAITVSRWERGVTRPTLGIQRRLNRLLKKVNNG